MFETFFLTYRATLAPLALVDHLVEFYTVPVEHVQALRFVFQARIWLSMTSAHAHYGVQMDGPRDWVVMDSARDPRRIRYCSH